MNNCCEKLAQDNIKLSKTIENMNQQHQAFLSLLLEVAKLRLYGFAAFPENIVDKVVNVENTIHQILKQNNINVPEIDLIELSSNCIYENQK